MVFYYVILNCLDGWLDNKVVVMNDIFVLFLIWYKYFFDKNKDVFEKM